MLSSRTVHVDGILSSFSQLYRNDDFVYDRIVNSTRVQKISDLYARYSKKTVYGIADSALAESSEANEIGLRLDSQGSYSTQEFGLAGYVSDRAMANADTPLQPRMDTVMMLQNSLMLEIEKRVADVVFAAGTYPSSNITSLSGTSQWDKAAANPVGDIQDLLRQTVRRPNVLVFGPLAWDAFRSHEKVLRALTGAQLSTGATASGGLATRGAIASLFEVSDVVVGEAKYDTEPFLAEDVTLAYLWGKHCAGIYKAPGTLSPRSITFATRFFTSPMQVLSEYVTKRRSEYLEVFYDEDLKIVASDLGALLRNVIP